MTTYSNTPTSKPKGTFTVLSLLVSMLLQVHAAPPNEDEITRRSQQNAVTDGKEKAAAQRENNPKEIDRALAEPSATQPDIPIDRELIIPFEHRPGDERDIEVRHRVVNAIWKTPLGQTLYAFLFDDIKPKEMPALARQFMRRIFSNGPQVPTRLAALQLLVEDLYVRGRLTDDAVRRVVILHGDLYQEDQNSASKVKRTLVIMLVLFFIMSLPFGSPIVRQETGKIWDRPKAFFRRVIRRVKEDQKLERVTPLRIFKRDVFKDFQISYAVNTFFATFGPVSMLFFLYKDWLIGANGQLMHDNGMLLGLDALLRATEF